MQEGSPELKPTHPSETKPGWNEIVVKTVHYGLQKMIMEKDVPVKMRDGITLYVNVFRPDRPGKFPVVMSADIYGKDNLTQDNLTRFASIVGVIPVSLFTPFESPDPGFWVPNDYIIVKVALRGSSNSGGAIYPISKTEAQDYYEVIEWAGVQEWSDGNVGLNGVSYLAMTQWPVAALNPPHLKAIIPWEGVSDMYREWAFHGGIPETTFNPYWYLLQKKRSAGRDVENIPLMQKEHPLLDAYWEGKETRLGDIQVPMYVCASWSTQGLHNRGTLEGFKQATSRYKWLEIHGRKEWEYYYCRESLERQKRFFDYFLKGVENDWLDTPRVRLEVRERFFEGMFRFEKEWPIAKTNYTKLYLDGETMTLSLSPEGGEARVTYSAGSGSGDKRKAVFKIIFDKDTELTGYMKLKLWVSAKGSDDMDLFVGVKKYDRRGKEIQFPDFNHIEHGHVASGWLRVSHRELDEERSTPHQPWLQHKRLLKLKENEIVPVEIEILPSSVLFRSGESLVLVVQGSEIVTSDLMPSRYGHTETVNRGEHVIHGGGEYDSHLLVPLIPPKI
jgi:predicted acyl esterase